MMATSRWVIARYIDYNLHAYDISMVIDCKPFAKIQREVVVGVNIPQRVCAQWWPILYLGTENISNVQEMLTMRSFPNL
jgi:hypothetical protein